MAKIDPKAEISPAVAAVVIIVVLAIAFALVWYFVYREPAPPVIQQPPGPAGTMPPGTTPGTTPGAPAAPPAAPPTAPINP